MSAEGENLTGRAEALLPKPSNDWYTLHANSLHMMERILAMHRTRDLLRAKRMSETEPVKQQITDYFVAALQKDLLDTSEVLCKILTELHTPKYADKNLTGG